MSTLTNCRSKMAGSYAFRDGFMKADPVLLEPIMKVEVETPEDYMGDIIGDLNRRRGMVQGMDDLPGGTKRNSCRSSTCRDVWLRNTHAFYVSRGGELLL